MTEFGVVTQLGEMRISSGSDTPQCLIPIWWGSESPDSAWLPHTPQTVWHTPTKFGTIIHMVE